VAPDPVDGSRPGEVEGSHTVEVVGVRGVVVVDPVVVGTPMRELVVEVRSAGSGLSLGSWPEAPEVVVGAPVEAVAPSVVGTTVVVVDGWMVVVVVVLDGPVVVVAVSEVVGGRVVVVVDGPMVVEVVVAVPEVVGGRVVVVAGSHTVGGLELVVGWTSMVPGGLPGRVVVGRRVVVGCAGRKGWAGWWGAWGARFLQALGQRRSLA
jgi:hypothetical protein